MSRRTSKVLLVCAFLSASLAFGAAPSYAYMDPADAGISDSDWQKVAEIGDYNNALMEYVDNQGLATLVFTGGSVPDQLNYPSDFTGFDNPDLVIYGEYSQFATNDSVYTIETDVINEVQAAGYSASAVYNQDLDVIDVTTLAPSSVTDPLVAKYNSKLNIITAEPAEQSGSGSTTTHGTPEHSAKKHVAAKKTKSAKKAAAPAPEPTPQAPTKVVLTLADGQ